MNKATEFPARCGLAILSGLVYAMAFPPVGWMWLVLPGVVGLLVSLQGQRGSRARLIGFLHGFAAIAVGLSWVWNIFDALAIPLWCTLAVFTALFAEMQGRAEQRGWGGRKDITLTFGTQSRSDGGDAWRNIALTVDPTGYLGEHTKVHAVHFFDDGTPGSEALPVETAFGKVGTPICFDCDYEGIARKMTAAGAGYFVVPTMDAESWSARQHDQHAELARIRAAENARWMFVAATSGVSQIIDPNGHLHARLGAMEQGSIFGAVKRESRITFYTRFGWLIAWCVLATAGAAWICLYVPGRLVK